MPVDRWSPSELRGKKTYWLLDLEWASQTFRISTTALEVESDDGTLQYHAGFTDAPTMTEAIDLFSDVLTPQSVSLEVALPVDTLNLIARGHRLGTMRGELSKVIDGQTWEERRRFVVGRAKSPAYSDDGASLRFTLEQELYRDTGTMPDTGAVNDASTTDVGLLNGADEGLVYPLVIGRPGGGFSLNPSYPFITGSAAVFRKRLGSDSQLVLAGHPVQCTEVVVNSDDFVDGLRLKVEHVQDAAGRTIAIVGDATGVDTGTVGPQPHHQLYNGFDSSFAAGSVVDLYKTSTDDANTLYVAWYDYSDPTLGGAYGANGLIRKAGDVLEFVLDYSSLLVDRGRIAAAKPLLAGFLIDAVIDEHVVPWEWVAGNLLPLLPVSMVVGPGGVYPVVLRYEATPDEAVCHLDLDSDPSIEINEWIDTDNEHVANDFTLEYAPSFRTGNYQGTARMGPAYIASTGYASARITDDTDDVPKHITVRSLTAGPAGVCRIIVDDAAGLAASDNLLTRTTTVSYTAGVHTVTQVAQIINSLSVLVEADDVGDTDVMDASGMTSDTFLLKLDDTGTVGNYYCNLSQRRYTNDDGSGVYPKAESTDIVYDVATAFAVLEWWARVYALEWSRVEMLVDEDRYGWLERGDPVTLTAERHGWSQRMAFVERIEWGDDGRLGLGLLLLDNPPGESVTV